MRKGWHREMPFLMVTTWTPHWSRFTSHALTYSELFHQGTRVKVQPRDVFSVIRFIRLIYVCQWDCSSGTLNLYLIIWGRLRCPCLEGFKPRATTQPLGQSSCFGWKTFNIFHKTLGSAHSNHNGLHRGGDDNRGGASKSGYWKGSEGEYVRTYL